MYLNIQKLIISFKGVGSAHLQPRLRLRWVWSLGGLDIHHCKRACNTIKGNHNNKGEPKKTTHNTNSSLIV